MAAEELEVVMMNVRPEHYTRVIKATSPVLVCRYSDSMVLSTGDQWYHIFWREEGPGKGSRNSRHDLWRKNLTVIFVSSEEEIKGRIWVNFNAL